MKGFSLNHVGLPVRELAVSIEFYIEVFGPEHCERIPTPAGGGLDVQWLRLGDRELHLFVIDLPISRQHHFAVSAKDSAQFHRIYELARARGIFDSESFLHHCFETPGGDAQMFVLDPTGNMFEVDYHDASALDPTIVTDMVRIADFVPQHDDGRRARLYPDLIAPVEA